MQAETVEQVVAGLRERGLIAHVKNQGGARNCVRVVLAGGAEALWDSDGAAGLEAQVLANGMLVGFVPLIPGSADFTVDQAVEAIANARYSVG